MTEQKPKYPSLLKAILIYYFGLSEWYKKRHPEIYGNQQPTEEQDEENEDQSVYEPDNPQETQEDDMESDLGLLNEEDDLW